jgi:hypothetical protein
MSGLADVLAYSLPFPRVRGTSGPKDLSKAQVRGLGIPEIERTGISIPRTKSTRNLGHTLKRELMSWLMQSSISGCNLPSGLGSLALKSAARQLGMQPGAGSATAVNSSVVHLSGTPLSRACLENYSPAPAARLALSWVRNNPRALKLMRHEPDGQAKPAGTCRGSVEHAVASEFSHESRSMEDDVLSLKRAALNSHIDTWVVGY